MAKTIFMTRNGVLSVSYDDKQTGKRVTRKFRVLGSYVHEQSSDGRLSQICEGLSTRGPTLQCDAEDLPTVIRRHWRKMLRNQRCA